MSNSDLVDFTKEVKGGQPSFFDTLMSGNSRSGGAAVVSTAQADGSGVAGPSTAESAANGNVVPDGASVLIVESAEEPAPKAVEADLSGQLPRQTPQQVSAGRVHFPHLAHVALERPVRSFREVLNACGLRTVTEAGKIVVLAGVDDKVILTLTEDGVETSKSVVELALASVLCELNCEPFYAAASISDREEAINEMAPYDDLPDGVSQYDRYVQLCAEADEDKPLSVYPLDAFRNEDGDWNRLLLIEEVRAADPHTDAIIMTDVEEVDLNYIAGLPFTVYFKARQPYVAKAWMSRNHGIKAAMRSIPSDYDDGQRQSEWLCIEHCGQDLRTNPLVVGPESREKFFAVRDQLYLSAKANRFVVPTRVPKLFGAEVQPAPIRAAPVVNANPVGGGGAGQDKNYWFDKLRVEHRPTREEYALFEDAVRAGPGGSLSVIAQKGIVRENKSIFRDALNSAGRVPSDYRFRLVEVREMDCDPITRLHAVIDVFSTGGKIPEPSKHIAKPVPAAIFQMIRAYSSYSLSPSVAVDYEWCLSA